MAFGWLAVGRSVPMTPRTLLFTLVAASLVAPFALANHTAPSLDKVEGGKMACEESDDGRMKRTGAAIDQTLPLLRTTDNGHLVIWANGTAKTPKEVRCNFEVRITGFSLGGLNPQGGILNTVSFPCAASGGATCTASAETDWWVVFVDPTVPTHTREITVHFDLVVDGLVVDSGDVRIVEPSVPKLPDLL